MLFQSQQIQQVGIARIRVRELRIVQSCLGLQNVDNVSRANLVAGLGGFQGRLRRTNGFQSGFYPGYIGGDRLVQVAGVTYDHALLIQQLLAGLLHSRVAFSHARSCSATLEQGKSQFQPIDVRFGFLRAELLG